VITQNTAITRAAVGRIQTLGAPVYISSDALSACRLGEKEKLVNRGEAICSSQDLKSVS